MWDDSITLNIFFYLINIYTHTHTYIGEGDEIREYIYKPILKLHVAIRMCLDRTYFAEN